MELEQEREAAECVEWLAALWELTEGGQSRSANPHLLTLLRFTSRLAGHPALDSLARLRRQRSRDQLIKDVVGAACGQSADRSGLYGSLQALFLQAEDLLGAGPSRLIQQARAEALQRVEELAGDLDPAADLAEVTGERLSLRVVLAPSVFLPPPQAGRHGVLVQGAGEWVAHLHFGFPLRQDPRQFGIDRLWLLGGAWHYAIHLYLERHWPPVERRLAERGDLAEAVMAAMSSQNRDRSTWTDFLRMHLNVAFKCLFSRRLGVPDGVHRAFARASGLTLFPWFEEWLQDNAEGAALAAKISLLPETLSATRSDWESLARSGAGDPLSVNLALVSASARRACLVVPDAWSQEDVDVAVAGWRLLSLPLMRYGEWARTRAGDAAPVLAFGEPERNPLVHRVLEQRGLSLDPSAADPAIIALSSPGFEPASWCVAIAVSRPETAAALYMETALAQTSSYLVFDGGIVIDAGRVSFN